MKASHRTRDLNWRGFGNMFAGQVQQGRQCNFLVAVFALVYVISPVSLRGSDLQPASDQLLEAGFHSMYGLNFEESGKMFTEYEQAHPSDPLGYAAEATSVFFAELKRLKLLEAEFEEDNKKFFATANGVPDPKVKQRMLDLSARTQTLAEGALRRNASDEQALFALALTNGILGDYSAVVEHRYWGSVKYGRQGDEYARKLLQVDPQFYDAYIWTGVTNYVYGSLSAPVRWTARLFGISGDKETGVANLRLAAEKGSYLKPYAKVLLAITYLKEKNKPAAIDLLRQLSAEFPTNSLFAEEAKHLATE